jgi:hypothetical protein
MAGSQLPEGETVKDSEQVWTTVLGRAAGAVPMQMA